MGWSLAHKTRPIDVYQHDVHYVRFTFNRPVEFKGYGYDTHIRLHSVAQGWTPSLNQYDLGPNWADYSNGTVTFDRWQITDDPQSLATAPPGFLWPIGGSIPYSRAWPP